MRFPAPASGPGRSLPHYQPRLDVEGPAAFTGDPSQGLFSLFDSDTSTLEIVSKHAKAMRAID